MGNPEVDEQSRPLPGYDPEHSRSVLYPIWDPDSANPFQVATALAQTYGTRLVVVNVGTDVPGSSRVREETEEPVGIPRGPTVGAPPEVPVDEHAISGGNRDSRVVTTVERFDADAVVLPVGSGRGVPKRVAKRVDCDVLTVVHEYKLPSISSILAPVAGGPHSGAVVDIAGALADAHDGWVELLHVRSGDSPVDSGESLLEEATQRLDDTEVDSRILEEGPVADSIVAESRYYDVTVIGAPRKGRLKQFVFGSTARDVQRDARNAVVTVRPGTDTERSLLSGALH